MRSDMDDLDQFVKVTEVAAWTWMSFDLDLLLKVKYVKFGFRAITLWATITKLGEHIVLDKGLNEFIYSNGHILKQFLVTQTILVCFNLRF